MNELMVTLVTLALSAKERELLAVVAKKGVFSFSLIQKHSGFTSGYTAVLLKRLISKGVLLKVGSVYNFVHWDLYSFMRNQYNN